MSRRMTRKKRRLYFVALGLLMLGAATALVLAAFEDNLVFFYGPTELQTKEVDPGQRLRIGGLVKEDSVRQVQGSQEVRFKITDTSADVTVSYSGLLPDLFREGQGVVVVGQLQADGRMRADEVLARHDENYMPPEVAQALEEAGYKPADFQAKAAEVGKRLEGEGASEKSDY